VLSRPVQGSFPLRPSRAILKTLFKRSRLFWRAQMTNHFHPGAAAQGRRILSISRRSFLLTAGAVIVAPHIARTQTVQPAPRSVRAATGLLATWQSTSWLGAEVGLFKKHGIDMTLPGIAVGGPAAAAGLIRGDWEFAHTGAVPVAEEVLKGRDVVILATPTVEFTNSFVMTRSNITELSQLAGKKVGIVTETGQTSVAARLMIEKAGATATYLPLLKFDRIFAALAAGEVDAGALPVDLRFTGQARYGWNAFAIDEFGTPSVFATTRKLIASDHDLVIATMQAFVETIHLFKTRPDIVVPMLQRYLNIDDRKATEALHAFYVPVFRKVPSPFLPGMARLRAFLSNKYPGASALKESDIADPSIVDELERSGFIERLYAS
jgi:ABC-type nitrate/sulfonate/bicarbonate transport system substrate-binding protein